MARLEGFEPTTLGSEDLKYSFHPVPRDNILSRLVQSQARVHIWVCYLVPLCQSVCWQNVGKPAVLVNVAQNDVLLVEEIANPK